MGTVEGIATFILAHLDPYVLLPCFDAPPELVVNDAEVWHVRPFPLLRRVRSSDALPGLWILHIRAAIPFQAPDVDGVVEDPCRAIDLPTDRRVTPRAPIWPGHAFFVELFGNCPRRFPTGKSLKDSSDDCCLTFVDSAHPKAAAIVARARVNNLVAIRLSARHLALPHSTQLTTKDLLAQVGKEELRHCAEHADVHGADLADVQRVELDPGEGEAVMKISDVRQFAAQSIQGLDYDHIKEAASEIGDKLLITRAEPAGAADGAVLVVAHHRPALLLDESTAELDLILDRVVALEIAAVPGVDDGAHAALAEPGEYDGHFILGSVRRGCPCHPSVKSALRRSAH